MTEFFGKLEKVVIWQICFFLKNMLTFLAVRADAAIKDNIIKSGNILNSLSQYVATFFSLFSKQRPFEKAVWSGKQKPRKTIFMEKVLFVNVKCHAIL